MKTIYFIILALLPGFCFAQNSDYNALINISVTNMKGIPSAGNKVVFISKANSKNYSVVTDKLGLCNITIPNGDNYTVRLQTFDGVADNMTIQVADVDYNAEYNITIKYQLPKVYTLKNVHFETGSSKLKPESFSSLNNLAELLIT